MRRCLIVFLLAACNDVAPAPYVANRAQDPAPPAPAAEPVPEPAPPPPGGFVERAVEAGIRFRMKFLATEQGANFKINLYDHGAGVAVADFDGDGHDDLYFCNQLGPNALYRNDGKGNFTDVTRDAGPAALADRICVAAACNDIDNDGDVDLYVVSTRGGNALFRNDGTGRFTDVTREAGVAWVGHSQGATFFDADADGDLDLLVTNTARWTSDAYDGRRKYYPGGRSLAQVVESPIEPNVFFRNRGDGTFENATEASGLAGRGWGGDVAVFDYDEDGHLDVFVSNMFGGCGLYRNLGPGRFENVTDRVLGRTPWGAVAAKAFDFDGDARLDLYVVDMHSDMWTDTHIDLRTVDPKRKYPGIFGPDSRGGRFRSYAEEAFAQKTGTRYETVVFGNALYRNAGAGKPFAEVSDRAGAETFWPWGIAAGDFDNDGHVDVFVASGMGYPWEYWRSPLLRNQGDGTFADCAASAGLDPPPGGPVLGKIGGRNATRSSRSAAVGDFDGDGRLDLVVNNFNDRPYLYMNRWTRGNWIAFRLRGTRSNRDAVGAVVRVHAGGRTYVRQVHAAGGYLAQSSLALHFGLGATADVDRCEIRWPSGRVQQLTALAANRLHVVTEPDR